MKNKNIKTALIVGVGGQDGTIAYNYLSAKKYRVVGIDKQKVVANFVFNIRNIDITSRHEVYKLIRKLKPDQVYFLAAFHHSSQDKPIPESKLIELSYQINVMALANFLEAIRMYSSATRIFYAASSLIFGQAEGKTQTEDTPLKPDSIYGITKLDGLNLCRYFRSKYNLFASVGILYNHESVYRSDKFVSLKIIKTALAIKKGNVKKLEIGDLDAVVDWGYAPDYVDAFWRILSAHGADDFIVATGQRHTVREFVEEVFKQLNLDWKRFVVEKKNILTRKKPVLIGNYSKLKKATGWKPTINFKRMIALIIGDLQK